MNARLRSIESRKQDPEPRRKDACQVGLHHNCTDNQCHCWCKFTTVRKEG